MIIQRVEVSRPRQRDHEVPPGKLNETLDLAFVVPFARSAKAVLE